MKYTWNELASFSAAPPSYEVDFQAWRAMRTVSILGWAKEVHSAELIIEVPGPVYVFLVKFEPRDIPEREVFVFGGVLTQFSIDLPHDLGIKQDAQDRLLLYFAHLLLFCFCRPKYMTPFSFADCLTLKPFPKNNATRDHFIDVISKALLFLGYESLEAFMPILSGVTKNEGRKRFLDADYYQNAIVNPIDVEQFANIGTYLATETTPVLAES